MVLTYNLWQMFLFRHIRGFRNSGMSQVRVIDDMIWQWSRMRKSLIPYLWEGSYDRVSTSLRTLLTNGVESRRVRSAVASSYRQ